MKTYTVIFYRQYDHWSVTVPFETRKKAEWHSKRYLEDPSRDYIKNITFVEVELPE